MLKYDLKVKELAQAGISMRDIASYLGISEDEVVKDYSKVFYKAVIDRNVEVAEMVYRLSTQENSLTAAQFWLKNIGKWETYGKDVPQVTEDKIFDAININILGTNKEKGDGKDTDTESD